MSENHPIQAPTDEELEELTQLRTRPLERAFYRATIVREAQEILDCYDFLLNINQYILYPEYLELVINLLRQRWIILLDMLSELRAEEERDQETVGLWED
ncbi:uncharacterized protein N7500_010087 [Penicillium coprophilum]|uniref:uncharacterized protein n=1 Tax=Penicillium coprophilum TaxID=36646 RepID=UPI002387C036|nr:uncharacterized protein N7500_010087 [Penicillium coprophilum]KAJ5154648.1 hypothetical protein N7500_010087 [Penicillium coprophilum]